VKRILMNEVVWPPDITGGSFQRGSKFAVHSEEISLEELRCVIGNQIEFSGKSNGKVLRFSVLALDEATAEETGRVLASCRGMDFLSIGRLELPEKREVRRNL
jgi:hypothetical protein